MNKGTILYIGGFELPDKDAAAHRVLNNAKIFRDLGYRVVFVDVDRSSTSTAEINVKKNIQGFDCWSRRFPKSSIQWIKYLLSIKVFKDIVTRYSKISAIVCYNFQAYALLKLKSYCKSNNIKLLADCTEWYEDKRIIKKFDTMLRMKYIHKKIDGVICISDYLDKYYKSHVRTVVIPPLVDIEEEKWKFKELKNNFNKINLVYSGRPGKHKDKLNYIIESLSKLNKDYNYVFNIIGITKQQYIEYYPEHREIIDRFEHSINFWGRITHNESIHYVKDADFVIFIREVKRVNNAGFPTKFVESISCGTPVITTKTSDLVNYLSDGKNGFFINISNEDKTIIGLNKILEISKEEITEMKRICRESKIFHYKNYVNRMEGFLRGILN